MKPLCLLAAACCALPFVSHAAPKTAAPPPVEMIADAPFLQPSSTLEFRFAAPMIARDEIGLTSKKPPVTIAPAVAGRFTWLSRSSGVFVPEGPWPLGREFAVGLSKDVKAADGKPLTGNFRATLKTPPFGRTAMRGGDNADVTQPLPKIMLAFNLAVEIAKADALFQFVNSHGQKIAAKVRYGRRRDYFTLKPEQEDWEERWRLARQGPAPAPEAEEEEESDDDGEAAPPLPNRLVIEPASALTPGGVWRLEMKRGLKSKSGLALAEPLVLPLGQVRPFMVDALYPSNFINSGRSLNVHLSHTFAPDITEENAAQFFRVEPAVPNLAIVDRSFSSFTLKGDFELDREYRLIVDAAVISEEGLPFEGHRQLPFRFAPVAPRLYLPAITGHQIRSGQRKFEALSANLKSIKVIAQVVAPGDAAASIKAFEKYENAEGTSDEQYQRMPAGLIRGRTIFERVIELPENALDARQKAILDWNEILGAQKAGVIFLTVEGTPLAGVPGKKPGAQALIQLTDIGVLWKKVAEGLRVTAFSMDTGRPLAGVEVGLLNSELAASGQATTDAAGTAMIALPPDLAWLVATRDEDAHAFAIGQFSGELPMSAFRLPIDYRSWEPEPEKPLALRAFIFTDRPLYRPGETVHVKGIVRDTAGAMLAARAGLDGVLKLLDPRGREVSETEIRTDERGAFDTELELGGGATGGYSLALDFPQAPGSQWQSGFHCKFEVADFQPNAFELDVALASRLAPGAEVAARMTAKYFFGAPLTKADARWSLRYARETFSPAGFEGWHFGEEDNSEGKILTLRGQGTFSGADGFTIRPQLPEAKDAPYKGVLTVEVTDINQQTVSDSRLFIRDAADFYLGLAVPEGAVFRPGSEIVGRAIAIRPDGTPVAQPAEVSAELIHVRYETVRVQGAGKAISFRSEKIEEVVGRAVGRTLQPARVNEAWEVRDGASVTFKAEKAGQYRLRMTAKDGAGRAVTSELPVFVSGPDEIAWDYRNPAQIDLVADKNEYQPGETARLLVKTPISGEALVTIERDERILRTMRVKLEGNAPAIEIPLTKADAPNVFVSIVLIRGREESTRKFKAPEYRYGLAMLRVSEANERLQITVAPALATVEPGQEVDTEVRVLDGAGHAVADAEVTFFAVDDGILALTGYERPAPEPIFSAPFSLAVRTGLTLFELLPEDPAALEFSNKGYLIGGGGLDGPGPKLRRDFPGTACWFPSLKTDAAGKVRVRFPAPDALTRYRLVAVAHAGAKLFGSAESAFAIRKPLMLLSAIGQFANVGDELIARAVVRNDTGADAVAEVALQLDGTAVAAKSGPGGTKARVEVKNGEARAVDFPVRLTAMGKAEWKWNARVEAGGRTFEDHVLAALTIGSSSPVLRETYLTELSPASTDLLKGVNPQLLEGTGVVAVTLSNTRLAELRESANHLLEYPYGCAEQTISSLIPWALLPELRGVLPDLAKEEDQAEKAISAGLDKLFAMQTAGGGLAYWPGGREPSLFVSAYAALACAILEKQEIDLPPGHETLLKYLSEEMRGVAKVRDERALADRVLAVYALAAADRAEPAYHEELFRRRKELSYESRALLALAIMEAAGPKTMADELLSRKTATPESFSWFGGPARERAIQLLAWSRHRPKDPEVGRLTKELLGYRANGHWGTTQQNAWALLALARYYAAAEDGGKPVQGTLVRGGDSLPFRVTKEKPSVTEAAAFSPLRPLGTMQVRNPSKGMLFGETRLVARPPVEDQPRQDRGYAVSRSYRKLADDGSLAEADELKVGDRVLVTLRVETTRPGHFVAIDDPLPAIFEAVNPAFQSQEIAEPDAAPDGISDYREMRADRVLYFCDHLPPGAFTFRYLARVRSAGTAKAGPTKVEEMYRPERFGLGESASLTSRLAEEK